MNKLATALCLSSTLLACAPVQAGDVWQGNWLVGISGGMWHDRGELDVTTTIGTGRQTVVTPRFQDDGWMLGVLGGYQWLCNRWLLGLELNLDWYDHDDNDNDFAYTDAQNRGWNAHSEYDRDWVVGLSGRMGYEIATYLMPYIRVGLEYSDDDLSYRQTLNGSTPTFSISSSDSESAVRVFGGLGLEVPVPKWNCFTLRFEYDFHAKGKRVDTAGFAASANSSEWAYASRKPYTQTFFASVVWNIFK